MSQLDRGCADYRRMQTLNRRGFLQAGTLAGFGATLPGLLRSEAIAGPTTTVKAKSVILLWLQGGVSHHETFDMKPDAPNDIRGEMSPIPTNMPGVFVGEYLPKLAQRMDKLAVIRSMVHGEAAHERGSMYMVEGRRPLSSAGTGPSGNPTIGNIVGHQLGMRAGLPGHISNPGNDFTERFIGHGWLPRSAGAFKGTNAASLRVPAGFSAERFAERMNLRDSLAERTAGAPGQSLGTDSWDQFNHQAMDIIAKAKAGKAFDYQEESPAMLQKYGIKLPKPGSRARHRQQFGDYCLTARRLVEAGVRFVTVGRASWDHHSKMFPQLRSRLPRFDTGFAGLLDDLGERGMLEETLVVYLTEFGRTPKINADAGRDHWPRAFSVAFAGAGIRPGQIIGSSDKIGGDVTEHPVSPEEIAATILHLTGIHPQTEFQKLDGRPIAYVDKAKPVQALLS